MDTTNAYTIKLTYFKESGKYYSSAEFKVDDSIHQKQFDKTKKTFKLRI